MGKFEVFDSLWELSSEALMLLDESRCVYRLNHVAEMLFVGLSEGLPFFDFCRKRYQFDPVIHVAQDNPSLISLQSRWTITQSNQEVVNLACKSDYVTVNDKPFLLICLLCEHGGNSSSKQEMDLLFIKKIIDHVPYFLFWKDRESTFLGCNRVFSDAAGLASPDEIVGKTDYDLPWEKKDSDAYRQDDFEVMKSGKPKLNIEEEQNVDGAKTILLTSKVPIIEDDGTPRGILGIYNDITVRKKLEEDLRESKVLAESANRAKSNFLAVVSHELRTPLNAILGMTQVLLERMAGSESLGFIEDIEDAALDLSHLVNDILEFMQLEQHKLSLNMQPFSLRKMFQEISKAMARNFSGSSVLFESHCDDLLPDFVIGDSLRTRQILTNLIINASKFTKKGSVVFTIKLISRKNDEVVVNFQVKDTGIGIAKQDIKQIFDRFYQVKSSFNQGHKGMGLGLAICAEIVKAMGSCIRLDSELDKGSVFDFDLVMTAASERQVRSLCAPNAKRDKVDAHVLVVEDNKLNQKVVCAFLEEIGCSFHVVDTGEQGITAATSGHYDIVLLDIGLPDMSGIEVASSIRLLKTQEDLPIVALTAHAMKHEIDSFLSNHMDAVLIKPMKMAELHEIIERFYN